MTRSFYALALFISAMLLFAIQPLIAKMILPLLGGTPAVWNTCLVFFQITLLLGYLYAHAVTRWIPPRRQPIVHLIILMVPFLTLPWIILPLLIENRGSLPASGQPILTLLKIPSWLDEPPDPSHPVIWLLALLVISIGIPFLVVSATAPLLQHWYACSGQPDSRDPYFLYAASNTGSILALLAYPTLLEPNLGLIHQASVWKWGYGLLLVLISVCAVKLWKVGNHYGSRISTPEESIVDQESTFSWSRRLRWLMLAAIPSSLLLGVTTFLSTNVAAVPLLWIIPLTLYLLTFVLVFSRYRAISVDILGRVLPFVILIQTFAFAVELRRGAWLLFLLHLGCFFLTALYCHGRLADDRPSPRYLTEFYLWLSAGGVVGGLFNALIAPLIFTSLVEYPLALVLACLFLPSSAGKNDQALEADSRRLRNPAHPATQSLIGRPSPWIAWNDLWLPLGLGVLMMVVVLGLQFVPSDALWLKATLLLGLPAAICYTFIQHPVRFALGIGALLLVGGLSIDVLQTKGVHQERSFFGVLTVVDREEPDPPRTFRIFVHGNTMHGLQNLATDHHQDPLAYYFPTGPVGQLMESLAEGSKRNRVAVLGLGVGALACYAKDGQAWTFFEIDPSVESIARTYFTFLDDAKDRGACVQVIQGDGRLSLAGVPDHSYDLIFADAFSSDAVPIHLLTRQALDLYLRKLGEHGLLIFNVTNRYVDLEPVLGALAVHAGLVSISCREEESSLSEEDKIQGKTGSHWIIMARHEDDLGSLRNNLAWKPPAVGKAEWTDDYSNLLGAIRW
jgi:hypothetical protein